MKYHLSLGSNIGERESLLLQAVSLLENKGVDIDKKSAIYETAPVGNTDQPWFLNQILEIRTDFHPKKLLRVVMGIEKSMGRIRTSFHGPRRIDIDILLAEDKIIRSEDLIIPHPELANRNFVLVALNEIAPEAVHPVLGKKIKVLCQESNDTSVVKLYMPA